MYRGRDRGGRFGGFRGRGGWRGAFRGGRGGGDHRPPENGFCVLHHRRRLMSDLVPLEGQPRTFRCDPRKECYQRQEAEEVTCHLHNRLRKVHQMREVRAGVWECLPSSLCRQYGNGPMGVPVVAPVGAAGGRGRDRDFQPASRRARHEGAEAASPWAPTAPTRLGQPQQQPGGSAGGEQDPIDGANAYGDPSGGRGDAAGRLRSRRGAFSEHKVWCARHGKHLSGRECDSISDCCFICMDNTFCLSTPLDDSAALQERDCKELLCTVHNTLRSVAFLRLNDDRDGYQCARGHPCRGVTLPQMQLAGTQALGGGADAGGGYGGQGEDYDGLAAQDAYFGAGGGAAAGDTYGEPSGREGVSSFFV